MFYIAYMCVTGPLLDRAAAREVADPRATAATSTWFAGGLPVNLLAVIFQIGVMINLAWPRPAVYGACTHAYFQWGAFTFTRPARPRRASSTTW